MTPTTDQLKRYAVDPLAFFESLRIPGANGDALFGEIMADFQRQEFQAIAPALLAVAKGQKPEVNRYWWERVKGGSKDSDLGLCVLWLTLFAPGAPLIQVAAADKDQAAEMLKAIRDVVRLNGWLGARIDLQSWRILRKTDGRSDPDGPVCEILAADIGGSHGARPDMMIANELSHITKQEFAETLMDNATKMPRGLVAVATNAGFTGSWQFRWREQARKSDRWRFHKFADHPPWQNPDDLEEARTRNTPARYARLFEGEWVSGGGDALDRADIEAAVTQDGPVPYPEANFYYIAGLDLGVKHDHSGLVVVGCNQHTRRIRVALCQSWRPGPNGQVDLMAVESAVLEAKERYNLGGVGYDPHQAQLMAQRLRQSGANMIEIPFVGKQLDKMARDLLSAFRSRMIDMYPDQELIRDLERLTIVERNYGYKLESVSDEFGHADRAISLAICLPAALEIVSVPPMANQRERIVGYIT